MRIGVDYDGVISDSSYEKIRLAKSLYNKSLTPEDCTTSKAAPILDPNGKEKYRALYKSLESGPGSLRCELVKNSATVLKYFIKAGYRVVIITTLDKEDAGWARKFLHMHSVPYHHFVCVPVNRNDPGLQKYPKKYVIRRLKIDVMIDDSYENLEPLSGYNKRLFLLDQPWNRHIKIGHSDIIRASWDEIYQQLWH